MQGILRMRASVLKCCTTLVYLAGGQKGCTTLLQHSWHAACQWQCAHTSAAVCSHAMQLTAMTLPLGAE